MTSVPGTGWNAKEGFAMSTSGGGQGRLAQVIASRGGLAPPEAPFVIEHREALIYMLCQAAELEHGIMCQYLFAAFSLKESTAEGLSDGELEAVTRWRSLVSHVATEEMLHLALVHNLLSAIGAAPHFARPNFPAPAHHYPPGVNLTLVPFGEPALRHFIFLERPEGMELKGAAEIDAPVEEAVPLMGEGDIVPELQDFATVGHLYRSIEHGIAHLAEKFGERGLFVGPPRAQATSANFRWPELVAVTGVVSAQQAIDTILEQGEGARGDWQDAHFGQFVEILNEYRQLRDQNPGFDPVRPVLFAAVRPGERGEGIPLIGDEVTARCTDLFNVGYEILLQTFERYFAHTEETDPQLATLAETTVALMLRVLKPLGSAITALPVGPEHPGMTAGPSFELFYETDYLMPHREAAWALLEERLRDAVAFCQRLQGDAGEPLATDLGPIGDALGDIADSLAAHFGEWGAVSRFAKPAARTPSGAAEDLGSLRSRASEYAAAVAAAPAADDAQGRLASLVRDANDAFSIAAARAETVRSTDETAELSRISERLVRSVLRPLAEAIAGREGTPASTPANAQAAPATTGDVSAASLDRALWALAQAATDLAANMEIDPRRRALLLEAIAALQDLALRSANTVGAGEVQERMTQLQAMQSSLTCRIQSSANGPYLVTSAGNLRNWLGEPIPTRPQMALCRCGESSLKPFCDGTHAQIGFSDAKDPKRVPDRRDTYVGQQVTIFDNRGTCQHSGFCSDRLATVFRTDQDPFVAPSGGRMDEIIRAVRACPSGALSYAIDGVEARDSVDHHGRREPTIEVTKDGPYRVRGGIDLLDADGNDELRNAGASKEHYALCRCGHSLNKPLCSGMHWYVDFTDPAAREEPTLYEWCGGLPALERMTRLFFEKHVPDDPLLAPLHADMAEDHPVRVAKWLAEAFGGPPWYSGEYGLETRAISQYLQPVDVELRARWVALIKRAADDAQLPSDAEFRAAFESYIEWESRLALEQAEAGDEVTVASVPSWGWAAAGPPGERTPAHPSGDAAHAEVELPGADDPVSFENHIKPLFRSRDQQSMKFAFDLWSYDDVKANAQAILDRLDKGTMPCDGAWPPEQITAFERWLQAGMAP
jgi:CDGSH-type Zn-finger protein/truncated hemoglobin YjbI/ferredoxin